MPMSSVFEEMLDIFEIHSATLVQVHLSIFLKAQNSRNSEVPYKLRCLEH